MLSHTVESGATQEAPALTASSNPPCPSRFLCLLLKHLGNLYSSKRLEVTDPGREMKALTATTQTKNTKKEKERWT